MCNKMPFLRCPTVIKADGDTRIGLLGMSRPIRPWRDIIRGKVCLEGRSSECQCNKGTVLHRFRGRTGPQIQRYRLWLSTGSLKIRLLELRGGLIALLSTPPPRLACHAMLV